MQRINYAGDVLLTGSAIADALLQYAAALARNDDSATVTVPSRREDGSLRQVTVLIGPASQLTAETAESEYEELVDDALVARIERETALLGGQRARPVEDPTAEAADWTEIELPDL